jgi:hypothetical protein
LKSERFEKCVGNRGLLAFQEENGVEANQFMEDGKWDMWLVYGGKEEKERGTGRLTLRFLKISGWALLKREMTFHRFYRNCRNDSDRRREATLCSQIF